jgi:hypothetical protein
MGGKIRKKEMRGASEFSFGKPERKTPHFRGLGVDGWMLL